MTRKMRVGSQAIDIDRILQLPNADKFAENARLQRYAEYEKEYADKEARSKAEYERKIQRAYAEAADAAIARNAATTPISPPPPESPADLAAARRVLGDDGAMHQKMNGLPRADLCPHRLYGNGQPVTNDSVPRDSEFIKKPYRHHAFTASIPSARAVGHCKCGNGEDNVLHGPCGVPTAQFIDAALDQIFTIDKLNAAMLGMNSALGRIAGIRSDEEKE